LVISIRKTIPASSSFYTTGGDQTITLTGTEAITVHSKKDLIKINRAKTKSRQTSEDSDQFDNSIIDLKKGTDEIVIKGWIEDDATDTAWEKFFRLRAMCSRGGPLTNLTIENIEFKSDTQEAFLEDIVGIIKSDDTGAINSNFGDGTGRIELTISIFIGQER
jgi:hypothetical protein